MEKNVCIKIASTTAVALDWHNRFIYNRGPDEGKLETELLIFKIFLQR